jgi:hypothetical protein
MANAKYPPFGALDFGRLDAREEAKRAPELLLQGFFDFENAAYDVASGQAWVLIGPKGAGKSACLEHLGLTWAGNHDRFLSRWDLASFPVADVTKIQVGSSLGPTSTQAAWEFLLLLRVFESLMRDQSAGYPGEVTGFHKSLVSAGLIGGPDLRTKFFDWSKTTVKFNVLLFGVEGSTQETEATPLQVVELLRRAISYIQTDARHILSVDGLDSFFAQAQDQRESLGALLDASHEVNHFLIETQTRSSVVLAIRHDMFVALPSTDSAKLGDHAVELDWSRGGTSKGDDLWHLINAKARASVPASHVGLTLGDIRKAYLAEPIGVGPHNDLPSYFIAQTRLIPRDLVALMTTLQKSHKGAGQVREQAAIAAVKRYSDAYFIREMRNNLSHVLPGQSDKVAAFFDALSVLPSREFNANSLRAELDGIVDKPELRALLNQLFLAGGLGVRSRSGGSVHTNFIFRKTSGGGFSFVADYVLHNALVSALNLHW